MTRQPTKRRTQREAPIQVAIVNYLRAVLPPECIIHHNKNEINKSGSGIARELAEAKRRGVVSGFPDIIVLNYANVGPVFFEVKPRGGYATKRQKEVHEQLRHLGYNVAVVRSVDEARAKLAEWGVGTRECRGIHGGSES